MPSTLRAIGVIVGTISLAVALYLWVGRPPVDRTAQLIAQGLDQSSDLAQFYSVFPDAAHNIEYSTGKYGTPRWRSQTLLLDRYICGISMDIAIGAYSDEIVSFSTPSGVVSEIRAVRNGPGDTLIVEHGMTRWLSAEELALFLQLDPAARQHQFELKADAPVEGLRDVWRRL